MNLHLRSVLRRLTSQRVPILDDCGVADPAPRYRDRSFASGEVSPDQAAVDEAVATMINAKQRILHVGVGASSVARRFAHDVRSIDGITVMPDEVAAAEALALANYRVWVANKYGVGGRELSGPYDIIADNNLGSFACCRKHAEAWLDTIVRVLAPGGRVVTHERGARFCEPGGVPTRFPEFRRAGERRGMVVRKERGGIWVWGRPGRSGSDQ